MPLYEFENTKTGKVECLVLPVAKRNDVPAHLKRITVPDRIGFIQNLPNPSHADQSMPRALREMEIQQGSRSKEFFERETGYSRNDLKETWSKPFTKEEREL